MHLWASVLTTVPDNKLYIIDQVLDISSTPIVGALVVLYRNSSTAISQCITDAQGIYRFDSLPPGDYSVEIYTTDTETSLVTNFTDISDPVVGNIAFSNISTSSLDTVISGGKTTGVSIASSGSNYSHFLPPIVTTNDGLVAVAEVDPITGSITGFDVLANGSGSSVTADATPVYDPTPPKIENSNTLGTSRSYTSDQINSLYESFNNTVGSFNTNWVSKFHYGSLYMWYVPAPHNMTPALASKVAQVANSEPLQGVPFSRHIKDIAYWPSSSITVFPGGSFGALYTCDGYEITHNPSLSEPYMTVRLWAAEVVTCNVEPDEYGRFFPVGDNWNPGGVFDSYSQFLQAKNTIRKVEPAIPKTSDTFTFEKIQTVIDNFLGLELFKNARAALFAAAEAYQNYIPQNFIGNPATDDAIPISFVNPYSATSPSFESKNPYDAIVYGTTQAKPGLGSDGYTTLSQMFYPYMSPTTGAPTSRNTGIYNPDYTATISQDDYNQIKGYLGAKFLPAPALNDLGLGEVYSKVQQFDSVFGTTVASKLATTGSLINDFWHEFGQAVGLVPGGTSWAKETNDFQNQVQGVLSDTAPQALWGKSFYVPDTANPAYSEYAFRHSWDSQTGAYTITKVKYP